MSLAPQHCGLFNFAGFFHEQGVAAEGVGQVERRGIFVGVIDGQSFFVVTLRRLKVPFAEKNVGDMANGMSERQGVILLAEKLDGNLVVLEGGPDVLAVPLNLAQSRMGLRRLELVVRCTCLLYTSRCV